jgi:hypothetical protein
MATTELPRARASEVQIGDEIGLGLGSPLRGTVTEIAQYTTTDKDQQYGLKAGKTYLRFTVAYKGEDFAGKIEATHYVNKEPGQIMFVRREVETAEEAPQAPGGPAPEVELVGTTDLHPRPTLADTRDWYLCRWEEPGGFCSDYYQPTGSAHAVGRAVLAQARKSSPGVTSVEVRRGEWPPVLAVVTDTAPAGPCVARFERDLESARVARHAYERAREAMVESMRDAQGVDEWLGANEIARRVNGLISRPTVLKLLGTDPQEAAA